MNSPNQESPMQYPPKAPSPWPPRLRVKLKQLNFYKAGYGGDVALEEHVDPLDGRHSDWPQYLSLAEHTHLLAEAVREAEISILKKIQGSIILTFEYLEKQLAEREKKAAELRENGEKNENI